MGEDRTGAPQWPSPGRAWLITTLLMLAYILSFLDRQILNLLVESIRENLGLTDVQISLLQGPAFVGVYVLASLPLGRLADSVNRVRLLALGLGFWTLATMACGFSRNVYHLAIARAGVGMGEATLLPAGFSLMADSFPPERRSLPVSIYLIGPQLGAGLAMVFGGEILGIFDAPISIGELVLQPWQLCFIIVSAPGLLLAVWIAMLKEPSRILSDEDADGDASIRALLRFLRSRWQLNLSLFLGTSLLSVMVYALQAWIPTYLIRVQGWDITEAGFRYGVVALLFSSTGILSGPVIQNRLRRWTGHDQALVMGLAGGLVAAALGPALLIADGLTVLPIVALISLAITIPIVPMITSLQLITPNYFRGQVSALLLFGNNVLGGVLAPVCVALLTDKVFRDEAMVGASLAVLLLIVGLMTAAVYLLGLKPFRRLMPAQAA